MIVSTPSRQFCSYIYNFVRTSCISMRWWCCWLCTRPKLFDFYSAHSLSLKPVFHLTLDFERVMPSIDYIIMVSGLFALGSFTLKVGQFSLIIKKYFNEHNAYLYPRSPEAEGGILFYLCPSKIFFVAFSATVNGRNLIFGHKLHIGMPYCE